MRHTSIDESRFMNRVQDRLPFSSAQRQRGGPTNTLHASLFALGRSLLIAPLLPARLRSKHMTPAKARPGMPNLFARFALAQFYRKVNHGLFHGGKSISSALSPTTERKSA
jgi:hypothetical protein